MNWIDFKKQRPEAEPRRQLWVRIDDKEGSYEAAWSHHAWTYVTHWAEIEPPKPDPFVEWFKRRNYQLAQTEPTLEAHMRDAWDAAIKYAKGNP